MNKYPDYYGLISQAIDCIENTDERIYAQARATPEMILAEWRTTGVFGPRQSGLTSVISKLILDMPSREVSVIFCNRHTRKNFEQRHADMPPNVGLSDTYLLRQLMNETLGKSYVNLQALREKYAVFHKKDILAIDDGLAMISYHGIKRKDFYGAIAKLYEGEKLPIVVMLG